MLLIFSGAGHTNPSYKGNRPCYDELDLNRSKRQQRKAIDDYDYFEDCTKFRKPEGPDAQVSRESINETAMHENEIYNQL